MTRTVGRAESGYARRGILLPDESAVIIATVLALAPTVHVHIVQIDQPWGRTLLDLLLVVVPLAGVVVPVCSF